MKKLLILLMLSLSFVTFAQSKAFTVNYSEIGIRTNSDESFRYVLLSSQITFNGEDISIYIKGQKPLYLTVISNTQTSRDDDNNRYQLVKVTDGIDVGYLYLWDSSKIGCLLVYGTNALGFRN